MKICHASNVVKAGYLFNHLSRHRFLIRQTPATKKAFQCKGPSNNTHNNRKRRSAKHRDSILGLFIVNQKTRLQEQTKDNVVRDTEKNELIKWIEAEDLMGELVVNPVDYWSGSLWLTRVVNDVEIIRQNFISLDHLKFGGDQR